MDGDDLRSKQLYFGRYLVYQFPLVVVDGMVRLRLSFAGAAGTDDATATVEESIQRNQSINTQGSVPRRALELELELDSSRVGLWAFAAEAKAVLLLRQHCTVSLVVQGM